MSDATNSDRKRSLTPLWIMIAIFAAPVIAAWFFYLNPQYLPAGRTNHGEFVHPVLPLAETLTLATATGEAFDPGVLAGKWTLVYLAGGVCDDACLDRLIAMRQIRSGLGESQLSIERLLILTDPTATALASDLEAKLPGMRVAMAAHPGVEALVDALGGGTAALDRIYILDPMGNLMMRYAPSAPAEDTLADMERLLAASRNWLKGARYGHE